ncbi:MAG: MoaD/ThiS family protein [Rubrivivax sp.]|nr:MoaD/ThiS family protein [Rubrivivax sp.]
MLNGERSARLLLIAAAATLPNAYAQTGAGEPQLRSAVTSLNSHRSAGLAASAGVLSLAPAAPTVTQLLDWAEARYPELFPGRQANQELPPYVYRYYPATGNYVGVAGSSVYVLGPVAGSSTTPAYVGEIQSFTCLVLPSVCPAPVIRQQPASTGAVAGGSARFAVSAVGTGLSYQWLRNGVEIPGAVGPVLELRGVAVSDSGSRFSVSVTSGSRTTRSAEVTLTVGAERRSFLLAEAGSAVPAPMTVRYGDGAREHSTYTMVAADASTGRAVVVEPAGSASAVRDHTYFEGVVVDGKVGQLLPRFILVWKRDRLHRIDLLARSGDPVSEPVSSLRSDQVCGGRNTEFIGNLRYSPAAANSFLMRYHAGNDLKNAEKSWAFFPGCGPRETLAVRLDMSATTPPVSIEGDARVPVFAADGSLQGVVFSTVDGMVQRDATMLTARSVPGYDRSVSPAGAALAMDGSVPGTWVLSDGTALLFVRPSDPGSVGRLPVPPLAEFAGPTVYLDDGDGLFVVFPIGTRSTVFRVNADLSVTSLGEVPITAALVAATEDRLVLASTRRDAPVMAIPRDGGVAQLVLTPRAREAATRLVAGHGTIAVGLAADGVIRTVIIDASTGAQEVLERFELLRGIASVGASLRANAAFPSAAVLIDRTTFLRIPIVGLDLFTRTRFEYGALGNYVPFFVDIPPMELGNAGLITGLGIYGTISSATQIDAVMYRSGEPGLHRVTSFGAGP